jgi:hypothetical protein
VTEIGMAIAYDFDICSTLPKGLQPGSGDMFQDIGMVEDTRAQMALFRDPSAVAALHGASDAVRRCLTDSGFGLTVHDSGAGPGQFPRPDEKARMAALGKLRLNLRRLPPDADWNGFDIRAFLATAAAATPVDASALPPAGLPRAMPAQLQAPVEATGGLPNLDDFFSAKPSTARAYAPATDTGPDMDAFFSNSIPPRSGADAPPRMTADDLRLTIDRELPKKPSFGGPVKLMMMAVGLFLMISFIGSGNGPARLLEEATGGLMVPAKP